MSLPLTSDLSVHDLKSSTLLDSILEVGTVGYCLHADDGSVIKVHGGHLDKHFSADSIENVSKTGFWDYIDPKDKPDLIQAWKKGVKTREPFEMETRVKSDLVGTRWHKVKVIPLTDGFISFFEDVTESHTREETLRQARDNAEEALRSKNFLLGRLSHEIRTPMNAVIGIADALIYHDANPTIAPKLELIQNSADKILRILDRALNHAKLDAEKLNIAKFSADPGQVVENVCELWKAQSEKNGNKIYCVIDKSVPNRLDFDQYRYEQCLNNLISNAVKFTQNGVIKVLLTMVEKNDQKQLLLAVQDSGIGMTKAQLSRVFRAFEQADDTISSRFGGTGLGMNITKQIIELMGGSISVKSEIGKGTIFALRLPIDDAENMPIDNLPMLSTTEESESATPVVTVTHEPEPEERNPNSVEMQNPVPDTPIEDLDDKPEGPYANIKVLVADDNPTNHVVVNSLLENIVYKIYTAMNGQEVLDILEVEDIDVILMDIHMPVMDGIEATLAIRSIDRAWKDVPIIALTADPQYQQKRLCLNIGMNDALGKPVKMNEILKSFDRVLNSQKITPVLDQAV